MLNPFRKKVSTDIKANLDMTKLTMEDVEKMDDDELENLGQKKKRVTRRKFEGRMKIALTTAAVLMSIYQLYSALFSVNPIQQRGIHLLFVLVLIFMVYPATIKSPTKKLGASDIVLIILSIASIGNLILRAPVWARTAMQYSHMDVVFGIITVFLVIEAARRAVGKALPIMAVIVIAYGFFGHLLNGPLYHSQLSFNRMINNMSMTTNGIFGSILGVSSTYIFLFILFGAFLSATGMSKVFNDLALSLAGGTRGGPAKVSILASGLMGTVSGSTSANVVTTGAFTIPLMKRTGYPDYFAGAVEAVASTGGQIMPPVMGSASFLIADALGLPYVKILQAAILPAVLYYVALWFMVDLRARKDNIRGVSRSELPNAKEVLKHGGHLLLPLIGIIVMLVSGYSAIRSALVGIALSVVCSFFKKETRLKPKVLVAALENGALAALGVASACAIIGTIVGTLTMTGVILTIGSAIFKVSNGQVMVTLILTMVICIIMGMGLPTSACYILTSTIAATTITQLGGTPLQAHMFVFYFGILASVTPPVATGAFAAAGLAGSDTTKTGFMALRLAIAGFIIPYMFFFSPELLLPDGIPILTTIRVVCTSLVGVYALSWAMEGYFHRSLKIYERIACAVSAVLLINTGEITDLIGVALFGLIFFINYKAPDAHLARTQGGESA